MKQLLKSRKAQSGGEGLVMTSKWALYIILCIVIPGIGGLVAWAIMGVDIQYSSYLDDVENIIIKERFLSSPACFAYQDSETGRVYPGIIDKTKFNQERMVSCFSVPAEFQRACFRLELRDAGSGETVDYMDADNYGTCLINNLMKKEAYYVLIRSGTDLSPGILYITSNKYD